MSLKISEKIEKIIKYLDESNQNLSDVNKNSDYIIKYIKNILKNLNISYADNSVEDAVKLVDNAETRFNSFENFLEIFFSKLIEKNTPGALDTDEQTLESNIILYQTKIDDDKQTLFILYQKYKDIEVKNIFHNIDLSDQIKQLFEVESTTIPYREYIEKLTSVYIEKLKSFVTNVMEKTINLKKLENYKGIKQKLENIEDFTLQSKIEQVQIDINSIVINDEMKDTLKIMKYYVILYYQQMIYLKKNYDVLQEEKKKKMSIKAQKEKEKNIQKGVIESKILEFDNIIKAAEENLLAAETELEKKKQDLETKKKEKNIAEQQVVAREEAIKSVTGTKKKLADAKRNKDTTMRDAITETDLLSTKIKEAIIEINKEASVAASIAAATEAKTAATEAKTAATEAKTAATGLSAYNEVVVKSKIVNLSATAVALFAEVTGKVTDPTKRNIAKNYAVANSVYAKEAANSNSTNIEYLTAFQKTTRNIKDAAAIVRGFFRNNSTIDNKINLVIKKAEDATKTLILANDALTEFIKATNADDDADRDYNKAKTLYDTTTQDELNAKNEVSNADNNKKNADTALEQANKSKSDYENSNEVESINNDIQKIEDDIKKIEDDIKKIVGYYDIKPKAQPIAPAAKNAAVPAPAAKNAPTPVAKNAPAPVAKNAPAPVAKNAGRHVRKRNAQSTPATAQSTSASAPPISDPVQPDPALVPSTPAPVDDYISVFVNGEIDIFKYFGIPYPDEKFDNIQDHELKIKEHLENYGKPSDIIFYLLSSYGINKLFTFSEINEIDEINEISDFFVLHKKILKEENMKKIDEQIKILLKDYTTKIADNATKVVSDEADLATAKAALAATVSAAKTTATASDTAASAATKAAAKAADTEAVSETASNTAAKAAALAAASASNVAKNKAKTAATAAAAAAKAAADAVNAASAAAFAADAAFTASAAAADAVNAAKQAVDKAKAVIKQAKIEELEVKNKLFIAILIKVCVSGKIPFLSLNVEDINKIKLQLFNFHKELQNVIKESQKNKRDRIPITQ
jgi:hypothetical protein